MQSSEFPLRMSTALSLKPSSCLYNAALSYLQPLLLEILELVPGGHYGEMRFDCIWHLSRTCLIFCRSLGDYPFGMCHHAGSDSMKLIRTWWRACLIAVDLICAPTGTVFATFRNITSPAFLYLKLSLTQLDWRCMRRGPGYTIIAKLPVEENLLLAKISSSLMSADLIYQRKDLLALTIEPIPNADQPLTSRCVQIQLLILIPTCQDMYEGQS